ncbi:NAD(P)-binding protein [Amniculicola lignicola CBS 123094]|uniref:NAD(P)-binding protein n=1 Tax=Amniculicola lignicola CBS 123094 TaxID=1392246 RepID=A0A6A5X1K0_9PLEO|nr:NAD(P)-binding protein [Amniculicola lignicola CBS 123094]
MTLTHPEWDKETSGLAVAEAFSKNIAGKNVLITGVSLESIGSSTAFAIASQSPGILILASRTQSKLEQVVQKIHDAYPAVNVKTVLLDLMSQESVKAAAEEIKGLTSKLDIIINNAGMMTPERTYTKEGIEGQFGLNHIGHFLFTNLLMPLLVESARTSPSGATRVINLSSLGHRLSPIRFHDYNFEGKEIPDEEKPPAGLSPAFLEVKEGEGAYNGYISYGQAKTANLLFSVYLTEHLKKDGILSYAVHPGSIWTGLVRNLDPDGEQVIRNTSPFWKTGDQGSSTTLVGAFDPTLSKPQGIFLHDCQLFDAAPHATDLKVAERLWRLSETLVKREFKL